MGGEIRDCVCWRPQVLAVVAGFGGHSDDRRTDRLPGNRCLGFMSSGFLPFYSIILSSLLPYHAYLLLRGHLLKYTYFGNVKDY